jgi:hypothetical protein
MYAAITGVSRAAAVVNVTVRPGYNFPNADAVLGYGYGICDKVATGRTHPDLVGRH